MTGSGSEGKGVVPRKARSRPTAIPPFHPPTLPPSFLAAFPPFPLPRSSYLVLPPLSLSLFPVLLETLSPSPSRSLAHHARVLAPPRPALPPRRLPFLSPPLPRQASLVLVPPHLPVRRLAPDQHPSSDGPRRRGQASDGPVDGAPRPAEDGHHRREAQDGPPSCAGAEETDCVQEVQG